MSENPSNKATPGTGNVFEDLDLVESRRLLLKARLASRISDILAGRGLTQSEAARVLGTNQPKVSALVRGELYGFSVERLLEHLVALGHDVEITIREGNDEEEQGRLLVKG